MNLLIFSRGQQDCFFSWGGKGPGAIVQSRDDACSPVPDKLQACPPCPGTKGGNGSCKPDKTSTSNMPHHRNPFIIYFLSMLRKCPSKNVIKLAIEAGKAWCSLPQSEKNTYIQAAKPYQKGKGGSNGCAKKSKPKQKKRMSGKGCGPQKKKSRRPKAIAKKGMSCGSKKSMKKKSMKKKPKRGCGC